jgi:glucokinase
MSQPTLVLSIDIGGTRTKYGLVDLPAGQVKAAVVRPTVTSGLAPLIEAVHDTLDELCERAQIPRSAVQAIGVGIPGFVDGDHVSLVWHSLSFLEGNHLRRSFEDRLGLPTRYDNDARLVALGEAHYGKHGRAGRLLSLTLGTGIGFGFVVDGQLQEKCSANHLAGHILIRPGARPCFCGLSGCLESLVCASALAEGYTRLCQAHPEVDCIFPLDAKGILAAAPAGSPMAQQAVQAWLADLCAGLSIYVNLYAPEVIVLGGGLSRGLTPYIDVIHQGIVTKPFDRYRVRVEISRLGERAGILGAASLCRNLIAV